MGNDAENVRFVWARQISLIFIHKIHLQSKMPDLENRNLSTLKCAFGMAVVVAVLSSRVVYDYLISVDTLTIRAQTPNRTKRHQKSQIKICWWSPQHRTAAKWKETKTETRFRTRIEMQMYFFEFIRTHTPTSNIIKKSYTDTEWVSK